jgi:sporulation-control protein spo0M
MHNHLKNKITNQANHKILASFGCPVCVLDAMLQSGNSLPKWDKRSRVGVYFGHSAQHATTVSLILNPRTSYISPQFHCVYDNMFDSPTKDADFNAS